jgi:thioredoxin-like negative regulator of GroEL
MQKIDLTSVQNEIAKNATILLYFYSDRCAPCVSLRPKVQELISEDFTKMAALFIDSEAHPEITAHYSVFANPTLIVFFEGREFQRWSKFVAISQIAEAIERPYNLIFDEE